MSVAAVRAGGSANGMSGGGQALEVLGVQGRVVAGWGIGDVGAL